MKENNWEERYKELESKFNKMQNEYEERLNKPANNTNVDIIRKLDIIGYLLKKYIKRQDLLNFKEKVKRLNRELEEIQYQIMSIDNDYSRYDEN